MSDYQRRDFESEIYKKHYENDETVIPRPTEGKHSRADREHSPLPWQISDENDHEIIEPTSHWIIADTIGDKREYSKANAELIVKAVNLHAKFLAALEDCWNQFAVPGKNGKLWAGGLSTLENVESLLKESRQEKLK